MNKSKYGKEEEIFIMKLLKYFNILYIKVINTNINSYKLKVSKKYTFSQIL